MPLELPHRSHFDLAVDPRRALIALERGSAEDRDRIVRLVQGAGFHLEDGLESSRAKGPHLTDPAVIRFHQDIRVEVDGVELDREDFVLHQELRLKSSTVGARRRRPPPLVAHSNRLTWIVGDHAVSRARDLVASARFGSRVTVMPVYYLPGPDRSLHHRFSADPWFVDVKGKRQGPDVVLPSALQKFLALRKDLPSSGGWVRAEITHSMDLYDFAKVFLEAAGDQLMLAVRGLPMIVPLAGVMINEPLYSSQRPALDLINAEAMWNAASTTAASPVKIFYIDCGVFAPGGADILIDQHNSVFIDQPIPGGYQLGCLPATGDCHGTQMVGVAGAQWDSVGLAGVAGLRSNITHISLRCASLSQVSDALAYAATVLGGAKGVVLIGLDVLQLYDNATRCMALVADAARFEAAIAFAQLTDDLLIVIPSGNYDPTVAAPLSAIPRIPPEVSGALIVGACNHTGTGRFSDPTLAMASRFGPGLSLVAPGENVFTSFDTTVVPASYASVWGTSFAAAHVAGVAALCRATFPGTHAPAIKTKLMSSVTHLTTIVPDPELGMGRIDGSKAVV
jgi:hypothetical protein